ncbi:unnamed protein product [Prorocentrum cordatum]|uniref:Uncharacterized protein n=1 Tax=Prorocentrum cordatum TaxID=2364126 RepID=A0ABN9Q4N5_9DINO|nr:unnamed protein product [Polarella glacialis]
MIWVIRQTGFALAPSPDCPRLPDGACQIGARLASTTQISACEKSEQWQQALSLLGGMVKTRLEPTVIRDRAGMRACEKRQQRQRVLSLLSRMLARRNLSPIPSSAALG